MFDTFSPAPSRRRVAWLSSVVLHAAAVLPLILFRTVLVTPAQDRPESPLVFIPTAVPEVAKTALRIKPKLRSFKRPKLATPSPRQADQRPILTDAPAMKVAQSPMVRPMPVIELPPPPPRATTPARETPTVRTAGFDDASTRKLQNEPNRAPVLSTRPAGFDAADARKIQNEPKRIASAGGFGSFDAQAGMGTTRPTVVSDGGFGAASFGNTTPVRTQPRTERAAFGDTVVAQDSKPSNRPVLSQASESTPVEITYKPKPAYTEEARRLQIEGEVVIEAVFTASGAMEIVRIIRGLGHGLDENAIAAVRSIRFHPAKQRGRPADSVATVRMKFELAY